MGKRKQKDTAAVEQTTPVVEEQIPVEASAEEQQLEALRNERARLMERLAEINALLPAPEVLKESTTDSPVATFRQIVSEHFGKEPRKQIIARGVAAGVALNTCKTQYQIMKGRIEAEQKAAAE